VTKPPTTLFGCPVVIDDSIPPSKIVIGNYDMEPIDVQIPKKYFSPDWNKSNRDSANAVMEIILKKERTYDVDKSGWVILLRMHEYCLNPIAIHRDPRSSVATWWMDPERQ